MAEKVQLQSLECSICHDAFKAPTLLWCGHSFCKVCLDKNDEHHRGQDFMECPLCRKRTKLERNRVAGLAPNFSLTDVEEELNLKFNGKSSEYCSLHSQVFKDILCEVCKEFICLTCFLDKHEGHSFKKKEELETYMKKKKKSLSQESEKRKAQINKSIANAERHMHGIHAHLENLDREIRNHFENKLQILHENKECISKDVDNIRNNSDKVLQEFIAHQRQTLQSIDFKNGLMVQEGIASTSTCTFFDSDAMETLFIQFLGLKDDLERDLNNPSIAHAQQDVENTRFLPADKYDLDLGTLDQDARESGNDYDQGTQEARVSEDDLDEGSLGQDAIEIMDDLDEGSLGQDPSEIMDDLDEGSPDQEASESENDFDQGSQEASESEDDLDEGFPDQEASENENDSDQGSQKARVSEDDLDQGSPDQEASESENDFDQGSQEASASEDDLDEGSLDQEASESENDFDQGSQEASASENDLDEDFPDLEESKGEEDLDEVSLDLRVLKLKERMIRRLCE